jgi:hypothetical protein
LKTGENSMGNVKTLQSTILKDGNPIEKKEAWLLSLIASNKVHLEEFIASRKKNLEELEKEKMKSQNQKFFNQSKAFFIGLIAVLGIIFIFGGAIPLGIIMTLGAIAYGFYFFQQFKKNQSEKIKTLEIKFNEEMNKKPNLLTTKLGEINLLVQSVPFEDKGMLIDKSGILTNKEFIFPDIPQKDRFKDIKKTLEGLKIDSTPLLDSGKKSDLGKNFQFLGVESEINEILDSENRLLDQRVNIEISMPAYQGNDSVVRSINHLKENFQDVDENDLVIIKNTKVDEDSVKGLEEIVKNTKEAKKLGEASIEDFLESSIQECEQKIVEIEKSRDNSILKILKSPLDNLKTIFDYPLTKFYCPSCLEAPEYLISKLPVRPEEIVEAPIDSLKSYENSEELFSIRKQLDALKKYGQVLVQDKRDDSESYLSIKSKIENLEKASIQLARKLFRNDTKKELERKNAILKFNIQKNKWCCSLCSSEYKESEIHNSRILKIKEDLIHPIWDNLWAEKHDEAIRILREKESELRTNMNEESKQLRSESDVFTQEYRAARSQLEDSSAGYEGNITELKEMSRFFAARGILPEEEVEEFNKELFGEGREVSVSSIVDEADSMERQLELEPESVFLRHGDIQEYPEHIRSMRKYFRSKDDFVKIIPKAPKPSISMAIDLGENREGEMK